MDFERRVFQVKSLTVNRRADGDAPEKQTMIEGHAAVFNTPSVIGNSFTEVIEPGFFTEALKRSDPRALFNHDENYVMGRMSAKTLTVAEDGQGLRVQITPPPTETINDLVLTPMDRGDLREMSFAWTTKPKGDKWESQPDGTMKRTLLAGGCDELYDVSVVTYPAYPTTDAALAMRSMQRWKEERGASGSTDLPLADRGRAWDRHAADDRARKVCSSDGSGDKDKMDWAEYGKYFFWVGTDKASFTSYKLMFADVVDGKATAIPRGIFAAAEVMQGGRGGVDIPAADDSPVKAKIAHYYDRMRAEFKDDSIQVPWDKEKDSSNYYYRDDQAEAEFRSRELELI